jgi:hypothetical protein
VVAESEGSTPLVPKLAFGHDQFHPAPVLTTCLPKIQFIISVIFPSHAFVFEVHSLQGFSDRSSVCRHSIPVVVTCSPDTRHGGAWGERRYSSYSFSTSALDGGGEWSASRPGRSLPRGKDPQYPFYRRLDGRQSRSGHRG